MRRPYVLTVVGFACVGVAALFLNVTLASGDYRVVLAVSSFLLVVAVLLFAMLLWRRTGAANSTLAVAGTALVIFLFVDVARRTPDSLRAFGPGELIVVPESYIGWVRIVYGVPGKPPLGREEGWLVVVVPDSGEVVTSAPSASAGPSDRFFHQKGAARVPAQVAIPGPVRRTRAEPFDERCIFVGSTEDLSRSLKAGVAQCSPGRVQASGRAP